MAGLSTFMKNSWVNATLRNTTYTSVATVYIALYSTDPRISGSEVSGGSYARQVITFIAPTAGVTSNAGVISFPTSTAPWGSVTWFAVRDAITGGNLLYTGALITPRTLVTGDSINVPIGNITITLI
jgi:hypothetical protein